LLGPQGELVRAAKVAALDGKHLVRKASLLHRKRCLVAGGSRHDRRRPEEDHDEDAEKLIQRHGSQGYVAIGVRDDDVDNDEDAVGYVDKKGSLAAVCGRTCELLFGEPRSNEELSSELGTRVAGGRTRVLEARK